MTIRARLTLIYVGAMVLTAGLVTTLVWWQVGVVLRASLDQALDTRAGAAAAAIENDGQAGLQETDAANPNRIFVAVFAADGRLVESTTGSPPGLGDLAGAAGMGPAATGGTVVIGTTTYAVRVVAAEGGVRVLAGASLASVTETQDRLARALLTVGGIAALLSLAGGWWLAGRALRPVALITAEARQIGAADLTRRVPVPSQQDELRALATTVNDMLDRVAEAARRQRSFVAAASHDLRTPIAALQAELELAEDERTTPDEMRAAIRAARTDIVRLGELAAALLDLAAADSDGRTLVRSPLRVDVLLEAVTRRVEPVARQRGTTVVSRGPGRLVRVDRVRVEQALTNLVLNAITHGPPAATVDIEARVEEPAGPAAEGGIVLAIDVLDRGPGIAPELAGRLFQPFTRGSNPSGSGAGLGLATAATAIRSHHGSIGFEPRPDGGTRFWLRVPA